MRIFIYLFHSLWLFQNMTASSRVLSEKLIDPQLVKKYPKFYGNQKFNTAFPKARHLSLYWARSIQSMSAQPTYWRSILILSSHLGLGLPSVLFYIRSLHQIPATPLLSPIRATRSASFVLLYLITRIKLFQNI